jgi:hypothetical protein
VLARRGHDAATEAEIAQAAAALLDKAGHGPETTARDRRVAGRTRATSTPSGPRPPLPPDDDPGPEHGPQHPGERDDAGDPAAEVIPLPIFDARKEAEQWRF